jgi:hypothetical protein
MLDQFGLTYGIWNVPESVRVALRTQRRMRPIGT